MASFVCYSLQKGMRKNSVYQIKNMVFRLVGYTGLSIVTDFNTKLIKDFLHSQKKRYSWSDKTLCNSRSQLNCFFRWCQLNRYIKSNPVLKILAPKVTVKTPTSLNNYEGHKNCIGFG